MIHARHRYIIQLLAYSFMNASEAELEFVESIIRKDDVLLKINDFFYRADRRSLFFGYFSSSRPHCNIIAAGSKWGYITVTEAGQIPKKADQYIYLLKSPGVKTIASNVSFDASMTYGNMNSPLTSVSCLTKDAVPLSLPNDARDNPELEEYMNSFRRRLNYSVDHVEEENEILQQKARESVGEKEKLTIDLVQRWCNMLTGSLCNPDQEKNEYIEGAEVTFSSRKEIEEWIAHSSRCLSVYSQVSADASQSKIAYLQQIATTPGGRKKQANVVLGEWKKCYARIKIISNEAEDAIHELSSLRGYLSQLISYFDLTIRENVPSLVESIKKVARNTTLFDVPGRLERLCTCISNDVVNSCRRFILNDVEDPSKLWKADPATIITMIKQCIHETAMFQSKFQTMKDEFLVNSFGRGVFFSEETSSKIIDRFHKTCSVLVSVFCRIKQLNALKMCGLDKTSHLIEALQTNLVQIQIAIGKTLAVSSVGYEKIYEAFVDAMNHLDNDIHRLLEESLKSEKSVTKKQFCLEKSCKIICDRDEDFLNQKYVWLVDLFGRELYHITELFNQRMNNPERSRNAPIYFGNIEWAGGILRRIDEPFTWFQRNGIFKIHDDANRVIDAYNKLTKALSDYKAFWLEDWKNVVMHACVDASFSVVTNDSAPTNLQVHMQDQTVKLVQEARYLTKHRVNLPVELQALVYQNIEIDNRLQQLREIAKEYTKCIKSLDPSLYRIIYPHFKMIDPNLKPGIVTIPWNQTIIDAYISRYCSRPSSFQSLAERARLSTSTIRRNLSDISQASSCFHFPTKFTAIENFTDSVDDMILNMRALLISSLFNINQSMHEIISLVAGKNKKESIPEIYEFKAKYQRLINIKLKKCYLQSLRSISEIFRIGNHRNSSNQVMFEFDIGMSATLIRSIPSFENLKNAAISSFINTLSSSGDVDIGNSDQCGKKHKSLYGILSTDIEVARIGLILLGSLRRIEQRIEHHITCLNHSYRVTLKQTNKFMDLMREAEQEIGREETITIGSVLLRHHGTKLNNIVKRLHEDIAS